MRKVLTATLVLGALVGIGAAPASAQDGSRPMPPRMELGGNFTLLGRPAVHPQLQPAPRRSRERGL